MTNKVNILGLYRDEARAKLTKLAKRAAKYGQTISWTERAFVEIHERLRWDGEKIKVEVPRVEFTIEGSAPKAGEYRFLATLEREPGGVLISAVPGEEIGSLGRDWDGSCEHCGKTRGRKSGFVVEDPQGARKIVGRSCLRDHMGTDSPQGLLQVFTSFRDALGMGEEDEGSWGGCGRWHETTIGVIAASRAAIALWGWRPKSAEGMTTLGYASLSWSPVTKSNAEDRKRIVDELRERGDHYQAEAEKVLQWGRELKGRSDYEHNLKVALAGDWANSKTLGLVVSAAAAYDRQVAVEEERKAKAAALPPSFHFGEIGKRTSAVVTVERIIGLPDYGFGPSAIYAMRTDDGALLSWKTSSGAKIETAERRLLVEVGTRARLTFTPKAHADFKGSPETRVSRCKFDALEEKETA